MKITPYQLRACWHAVKSFIPWPIRRLIRYAMYLVCFLIGGIVGILISGGVPF